MNSCFIYDMQQVTLKLEALFKRSVTYITKNDLNFGEDVVKFGRQHEFADFTWYPSQKQVIYRVDDRESINATGNGLNNNVGFRSTASLALATIRTTGKYV